MRHNRRDAGRAFQCRDPIGIVRVDPPAFGHRKRG
jgi:hypothetical protein